MPWSRALFRRFLLRLPLRYRSKNQLQSAATWRRYEFLRDRSMKKLILILLFLSTNALAEVKHSIGVGANYAWAGYQLSVNENLSKLYLSVNPFAVEVGYQYFIHEENKHSLGASIGSIVWITDQWINLSYNYYVNGRDSNGFVFTIAAGDSNNDESGSYVFGGLTAGIGYQF